MLKEIITGKLSFISSLADQPTDTFEQKRQYRFLVYMGLLMNCGAVLWATICTLNGFYWQSLIPFGYAGITAWNFTYLYFSKNFERARSIQLLISLILPFLLQWSLGGFVASGGVMLWSILTLLGAFTFQESRSTIQWLAVYLILTIFSGFIDKTARSIGIEASEKLSILFFTLNLGLISTIIFILVFYFVRSGEKLKKMVEAERNRMEVLAAKLAKYLSPEVYDSIFSGERDVKIETYRKNLTIFFSDIAGFTETSEYMAHEQLVIWLNNYLNKMAEVTLRYQGTLDKFIGDTVMVFFGDPQTSGEKKDALKCVLMAMEMRAIAKQMKMSIRIGINSGECTVGNFGSENRMDYTIIGKNVNLAARLESNSEPGKILISESTYEFVKDVIRCEEKGKIRVKGIDRDIMTYWAVECQKDMDENEVVIEF
jgi:adenylate cyclase